MAKYLITDKELVQGSPLSANIDFDKYRPVIEEVQTFVIEPILGTKLFDKLMSDSPTHIGLYKTIIDDYVKKIIIHVVAAEYLIMSRITATNAGTIRHLPEGTETASRDEVNDIAAQQKAKADIYIERLDRFLCDKVSEIPEYTVAQDENYDIDPRKDVTTMGGWFIPHSYDHRSNIDKEIWKDIFHDLGR